ncbi:hypothetical protein ACFSQE_05345 [Vogesella fluminis]|uniref:hypothetical protein n=1 Tax=Vogesella fluminis TaxID=1069161 RepID=UPI003632EDDA
MRKAVGQPAIPDQVVTVEAVAFADMQIDVVEAGAAVNQPVVDHEALQVQHAEQLPCLYRHAVDRDLFAAETGADLLVPLRVAGLLAGADQAASRTVKIDKHADVQLWSLLLGLMQCQ